MSDAQWCAVWPDPRSRSRALQNWKSGRFQQLSSLPFTVGAVFVLRDVEIGTCQLWSVDHQSLTGLIYLISGRSGHTACHSITEDWIIPASAYGLNETFCCVHFSRLPQLFNEPNNPQNCSFLWRDLDPHLTHGSLGPHKSPTKTASWLVQPFLQV